MKRIAIVIFALFYLTCDNVIHDELDDEPVYIPSNPGVTVNKVLANPSATTADISWIASEASYCYFYYGTGTDKGTFTEIGSTTADDINHNVNLSSLTNGTTYNFYIKINSKAGNSSNETELYSFTTTSKTALEFDICSMTMKQVYHVSKKYGDGWFIDELSYNIKSKNAVLFKIQLKFNMTTPSHYYKYYNIESFSDNHTETVNYPYLDWGEREVQLTQWYFDLFSYDLLANFRYYAGTKYVYVDMTMTPYDTVTYETTTVYNVPITVIKN